MVLLFSFLLAYLSTKCSVSYCDNAPSVGVRPPMHIFLVYTVASTCNQSVPKLVRMYVIIRSQMSVIMDVIRPELSKLSALELENFPYLTVYILASANINQSAPNLVTVYMTIRSQMVFIMVINGLEHPEVFALEFGKIAEFDFVYTLASTNINQSVPNLVKINTAVRSRMSSIMNLIGPELYE